MTILCKEMFDRKTEVLEVPLVTADGEVIYDPIKKPEVGVKTTYVGVTHSEYYNEKEHQGSMSVLLLTALFLVGMGIVGGLLVYNQFARMQVHRMTGCCRIPYDVSKDGFFMVNSIGPDCDSDESAIESAIARNDNFGLGARYFLEQFEIDPEVGNYEKINVPNFHEGRHGRFIHDFNINKTGIIDVEGKRCFVMPLDQNAVLPPKSLFDLVQKMSAGYYDVNMTSVKQNMKVVLPPIGDAASVGAYIAKDCFTLPIYELKPVDGKTIVKRSIAEEAADSFSHFAGNNIQQLNILNLNEVYEFEDLLKNA